MPSPTVRLYGRSVGSGSHAQVTAGFAGVLRGEGLLAGLVALDRDLPDDAPQPGGALAPHAILTGPLGFMAMMRRATQHRRRYAMVAPNSTALPPGLVLALEGICTDVLVPSDWAHDVVAELTSLPIRTVPHGVAPEFAPNEALRAGTRERFRRGEFEVLHLSSSERERKSTHPLIEAWAMLFAHHDLPSEAKLRLVLDAAVASKTMAWMAERVGNLAATNIAVTVRLDAEPSRMAQIYGNSHLVCQPSRGEGFGLCPLEALASGVPIAATKCTGHTQWFREDMPGAVRVEHGPDAESDDMPGALAPSVEPDAIAASLRYAYDRWEALDAAAWKAAPAVRAEWDWGGQLAPFVELELKNT